MLPNWQALFAPRPLAARAVCLPLGGLAAPVWFASASSADLGELPGAMFLTSAESSRANAFKFGQPRENFTLGRLAGKLAVSAASGPLTPATSPRAVVGEEILGRLRAVEIGNGERGEPVVCAGGFPPPPSSATDPTDSGWKPPAGAVSLSHVKGLGVAVAFSSGQQVGLDLELIDVRRAETVRKGVPLSAEEEAWLKRTSLPEATALLLLWTARESLGKALGCGLACQWESLALRRVEADGAGGFAGEFLHQRQFQCVSWVGSEAVLSLAFAPT